MMSDHATEMEAEGIWQQFKGKLQEMHGEVTDDELEEFKGNANQAMGYLKEKYGDSMNDFEAWWNEKKSD